MLGQLVTVLHIFISCFLILIVLLQQGKGADAGATFGGGGQTFFGATGADNLLTKVTTITAIAFMCTSILLATSIKTTVSYEGELMKKLDTKTTPAPMPTVEESKPLDEATGSESAPVNPVSPDAAAATKNSEEKAVNAESAAPLQEDSKSNAAAKTQEPSPATTATEAQGSNEAAQTTQ